MKRSLIKLIFLDHLRIKLITDTPNRLYVDWLAWIILYLFPYVADMAHNNIIIAIIWFFPNPIIYLLAKDFGISRTHYCNVENGKKPVTESFLKVLASGYKIPMEAFIPNENGDLMQYCECTNDFVNAIIDDYFNSFEIRKYYIDEYEQPYYGVLSYLHDIGYTVEYELLQEAHLQDSFDSATGSVDVKKFAEDGVVHVYSNETGKDVAQIPLTKLSELEKEVKDFVEYKLSTYKVANPTKRSDLVPKSIYAFDIPNEIARVKRYKEYAEYCLKQLEQMQKEG